MTTLTVNLGTEDFDAIYARFWPRVYKALGQFATEFNEATGDVTLTFPQDLTTAQQDAIRDGARAAKSLLTPAERNALEAEIDGLRTYHALASPTAAQTVQATKAIIRVLRAILRD